MNDDRSGPNATVRNGSCVSRPPGSGRLHMLDTLMSKLMKAAVFVEPNRIVLEDKPIPSIGPRDALLRVTTTTICETDVHILKGEYPVARGLTVGHEPVGVIAELGSAVTGFEIGQRVIAGAITPIAVSISRDKAT